MTLALRFHCACACALSAICIGLASAQSQPCRIDRPLTHIAELPEASGVAVSRRNPGRLWAHNDSGEPVVFAIDTNGAVQQRVRIVGAKVRNWEDIAVAPCPVGSCLYIADIGDNRARRRDVTVYRVPEPAAGESETKPAEVFQGTYPDRPHDAEAMFVTASGEIFLVTKEKSPVVYAFPSPPAPGAAAQLRRVGTLPEANNKSRKKRDAAITGAGVTADGTWVALRSHDTVSFFHTSALVSGRPAEPIEADLTSLREPQGEGVAFGPDGAVYLVGEGRGGPGTFARLRCTLP